MHHVAAIDGGYADYQCEQEVLAEVGATFEVIPCAGDAVNVAERIRDCSALLVRESRIAANVIESMPRLQAIVRYGIGVDNIDLDCARRRRIKVANVPDYGTEEVSDQALALLLAVSRRVTTRNRDVRAGRWNVGRAEPMYRMAGRTLGLVGYGRIARAVERKLRAFGIARVLVHDPNVQQMPAGAHPADLDTLCRESDYISLHAPLNTGTHHLLDARRIGLMKPTAVIVNTARGPLIDEAALVAALREGRLLGAGLDVLEREPPSADNPLLALDNVVLSDHTGWYSEESMRDLQRGAAAEVARVLCGQDPIHWVNR